MNYSFSRRSRQHLAQAHPKLRELCERAIQLTPYDIGITDCARTIGVQQKLIDAGASRTLKSRHRWAFPLDKNGNRIGAYTMPVSHAIDYVVLIAGRAVWNLDAYLEVNAKAFKPAAKRMQIAITCGADWRKFKDGPHIQLAWSQFPAVYADAFQERRALAAMPEPR